MSSIGKAIEHEAKAQLVKWESAALTLANRSGTAAAMCAEAHEMAVSYYENERARGKSTSEAVSSATRVYLASLRQIAAWCRLQEAKNA